MLLPSTQKPRPATEKMARPCPLPLDMALEILEYVDSPGTLFSAVLTCRVFWLALESRRAHVLRCVLGRYITPRLLPLAVAAYEAGGAQGWDAVEAALQRSVGVDPLVDSPPPRRRRDPLERISPLTREAAAALTEVHRAIAHFSLDLARPALALFRSIHSGGEGRWAAAEDGAAAAAAGPLEPTQRELQRIQRAFYRYQIYCNTAGRVSIQDLQRGNPGGAQSGGAPWSKEQRHRAQTLLVGRWSTVANEQLACVCDFLERRMQLHFETLAQHDVEWGARKVDWVSHHIAVPHRRFLLNGGLVPLHRMSRTSDEAEWKRIIEEIDAPRDWDQDHFRFLETLEGKLAVLRQSYLNTCLVLSLHGQPGSLPSPTEPPPPPGWEDVDGVAGDGQQQEQEQQGQQEQQQRPCYMSEACHVDDMLGQRGAHLREAGCVFWDGAERARVAGDEALRKSAEHGWRYARAPSAAVSWRALAAMRRSWERRAQIWARGGAGHWEEGDESRVVYGAAPS